MKNKKMDNNSKFLFMMSGFFVILFALIFISTSTSKITYSAGACATGETNVGNYCCETSTKRTNLSSTGGFNEDDDAMSACMIYLRNNIIGADDSNCNVIESATEHYYNYNYVPYETWEAAVLACEAENTSQPEDCETIIDVNPVYKYTITKQDGFYMKSNCTESYDTCTETADHKWQFTYEGRTFIFDIKDRCNEYYANALSGECEYQGIAKFYDGNTLVRTEDCRGIGSHCDINQPTYACANGKTFLGWTYTQNDCSSSAIISDKIELFIGPSATGTTDCNDPKIRNVYACCESPSSSSAPSTSRPSTAAPSTAAPSTSKPSTQAPSTAAPSTIKPSTATPSTAAPSTVKPSTLPPVPPENPDTGNGLIILLGLLGVVMVAYSVWYFKKNEE